MKTYQIPPKEGESGERETIPNKKYNVVGFEFIIREDNPPQFTEILGVPKVLIKFLTFSGEEGPAGSFTAPEFVCLVQAFGADWTPDPNTLSESTVLIEGMQKANEAGKSLSVESKDGWAKTFDLKLHPPEGKYQVKFKSAHRQDREEGNLHFTRTEYNGNVTEYLIFEFEIVGDAAGKQTPYDGFVIGTFMSNVFMSTNDQQQTAEELGTPIMLPGINNARWNNFVRYFAPSLEDYDWEIDPQKSEYGVSEVLYPQYVIINEALKQEQKVIVYYENIISKRSSKWSFELADLPKFNEDVPVKNISDQYTLQNFVDVVKEGTGLDLFETEDPIKFNTEGQTWVKENIAPIWERNDFNKARMFSALTSEQINILVKETTELFV